MAFFLHDKAIIERELSKNILANLYTLGDLDDFFWPLTSWYASGSSQDIKAIALLYAAPQLPTLIATSQESGSMRELLSSILHLLPQRLYAHLSPGLESVFSRSFQMESFGDHHNMGLTTHDKVCDVPDDDVVCLGLADQAEIVDLYQRCYPGNWFDQRMLETGKYFGIRNAGALVSIAGVHVYSPRYRVAALGNIVTDPACRGRGYARQLVARTCRELLREGCQIGLKVKSDNAAAIACYQKLGFEVISDYKECLFHVS